MRGTLTRGLCGLAILTAGLCLPSVASADVHLAIGSRIEPLRYTSAFLPNSNTGINDAAKYATGNGFQSASLAPYFGLFFAQKYGLMLSFDVGYAKSSGELQAMGMPMATTDNNSYFQFGVGLGAKIYFNQPRSQKVSPYLYVDVYKYFSSVATDNAAISGEQASAQAAVRSPTGGTLAIGAEYFLSPGFSIGSEIFGLRVSGVSSEYKDAAMTRHSSSFTQVSLYTGLTLNYRFQVQASVQTVDDDSVEQTAAPKRKRRPVQQQDDNQPPALPAPSPEAID
jgi:hypothetical protein